MHVPVLDWYDFLISHKTGDVNRTLTKRRCAKKNSETTLSSRYFGYIWELEKAINSLPSIIAFGGNKNNNYPLREAFFKKYFRFNKWNF